MRNPLKRLFGFHLDKHRRWFNMIGVSAVGTGTFLALGNMLVLFLTIQGGVGWFHCVDLLEFVFSALLVAGGVLLLMRKQPGKTILTWWAWIYLVLGLISVLLLASLYGDLSPAMRDQASSGFWESMIIDGVGIGYAILLLVLLSRRFVDEVLRRW